MDNTAPVARWKHTSHQWDDEQRDEHRILTDGGMDFTVGERVVDTDQPEWKCSAGRIVDLSDVTAAEFRIDTLDATVAGLNDEYPSDDPVVGIAFESDLDREFAEWRVDIDAKLQRKHENESDPKIDPGPDHLAALATHPDTNITVYHYPESRLRAVDEEWESPSSDTRSSGRHERDRVFGDHPEAVEAFVQDACRLFTEPGAVADELQGELAVGPPANESIANAERVLIDVATPGDNAVKPRPPDDTLKTRGGCAHTRDDDYRPEDDAIVCWNCSDRPHNRPEKFSRDDPASPQCEQFGSAAWKLRNAVIESVDLSDLPETVRGIYTDDSHRLLRDLAALRSGDDDRIRRTALRMAYRFHLSHVDEYNYSRALALLRDRGAAADLPIIGDGSRERPSQGEDDPVIMTDGGRPNECDNIGCENPPAEHQIYCEECIAISPQLVEDSDAAGEAVNPAGRSVGTTERPDTPREGTEEHRTGDETPTLEGGKTGSLSAAFDPVADPEFDGSTEAVRDHYRRASPVLDALESVGEFPTSAFAGNSGWYRYTDAGDLNREAFDAGHRSFRRAYTIERDREELLDAIEADPDEDSWRSLYAITSYKDPEALYAGAYSDERRGGFDGGEGLPSYADIRALPFWIDADLADDREDALDPDDETEYGVDLKARRGDLDPRERRVVERAFEAIVEEVAAVYDLAPETIAAFDSGGGFYPFGPAAATLPIAERFNDPEDRERLFDELTDRINAYVAGDADTPRTIDTYGFEGIVSRVEERVPGAEYLLDADALLNKNRQTKAPGSIHKSHDVVVTPLRNANGVVDYSPTTVSEFAADADLRERTVAETRKFTEDTPEARACVEPLVATLFPEYADREDCEGWTEILDAWLADEHERELNRLHQQALDEKRRRERRREIAAKLGDGVSPDDETVSAALAGQAVTSVRQDVFDDIDALDVSDIIRDHACDEWDTSNRGHETTFDPNWRTSGSGMSCAVPNGSKKFVDNACNGGGGPAKAYALGERILPQTDGAAAMRLTGQTWGKTIGVMRADGYPIAVYIPEAGDSNSDGEEYEQTPYWAVVKAAVALGVCEHGDLIERESEDGSTYTGLPRDGGETFNTTLDALDEAGIDHGREHIDTGEYTDEDEDIDPRSIDVTFEPGVAWRAANAVTPANLDHARQDDDDLREVTLDTTDDRESWRCPCCGGSIHVVRAVAIEEGLTDCCDQPLINRRYDEAYRRARRKYGAPLPEYVSEETATERWDVIQGALEQLDHYYLDSIRSEVTALGGEADKTVLCEIDPCWTDSASGRRIVAFRSGMFYCREHERALGTVRFVALEEGIIEACDDQLAGADFREAYAATRDRGAPLPRWNVGDPDHRPVLPPADELVGDDAFATDWGGLERARNGVEDLYADLATDATGAHLLAALTALGKTTAAVKTAREHPSLYLGPRKELQREVEEKAEEYGVSWMHLPVLAEDGPDELAVALAVDAVREDGKGLLRDHEALLDAAGLDPDEDGHHDDEADEYSPADERFETPADAREAGFDSLTAARSAVERADAAAGDATGGEDGEQIHLDRASCPTANGEHGVAWQLAVHVARELGSTPKEIHVDAKRLFGEEISCQHGEDEDHGTNCPYSLAWGRATNPEDPFDLLIGNYGHGHVAGARTYYYKDERDRTRLDPRTVAIDEFPGEAYASSFGEDALDHARWLAATLVADVKDREALIERDLWSNDWTRAWLRGDGNDHPAGERALAHLDGADACRELSNAVDAARTELEDEETAVVENEADEAVVRSALERLDELAPGWDLDAISECYETLSALDLRSRTALTDREEGLLPTLIDSIRTLDQVGDEEPLVRGDGVLNELVTEAIDAGQCGDANARPLLDAARTAVRGGEDGCRELTARADDAYAHPDAYLLLYGAIARENEQESEDMDDADDVAETIDTAAFGFDHRRDGGRLKRSQLGRATILWDRDHHGAYVHDPPEFEDRAGSKNPVVGLDATGREELWSLALGQDVEREDIHETTSARRKFLRDVLNVQVVQTTPHQKFYEGSTKSKNFDPDVALVRALNRDFGGERIRADRITSTGPPGVITTKCVREEIEGRLNGHASVVDNYGNVTGSNALAGCRLGAVLGTQHYGDHTIEKWAALAGESVARTGRGTALDYDSDVANEYLKHMSEDQTMQAILRFGRDEGGAIVFAHTAALREELPVVADGAVATTYSSTAREVRDAALDYLGRDEAFTADDIESHPDIECSRRSIQRALREFTDLGYIERHDPGPGRANQYQPIDDPGVGNVNLPSIDSPELGDGVESDIKTTPDSDRTRVHYTWSVGVRGPDEGGIRPEPVTTATLPAPVAADGGDPPPDTPE